MQLLLALFFENGYGRKHCLLLHLDSVAVVILVVLLMLCPSGTFHLVAFCSLCDQLQIICLKIYGYLKA